MKNQRKKIKKDRSRSKLFTPIHMPSMITKQIKNAPIPLKALETNENKIESKSNNFIYNEIMGISFLCLGILIILSLFSYDPMDTSFNVSSTHHVNNWIGHAGSYLADILFQLLGIGATPLGIGFLLAGIRLFLQKRVLPLRREFWGGLSLVLSLGACAHLIFTPENLSYPIGGLFGALIGDFLFEKFAHIGSLIISISFLLLSLVITTNGIFIGILGKSVDKFQKISYYFKSLSSSFKKDHTVKLDETNEINGNNKKEFTLKNIIHIKEEPTFTLGDIKNIPIEDTSKLINFSPSIKTDKIEEKTFSINNSSIEIPIKNEEIPIKQVMFNAPQLENNTHPIVENNVVSSLEIIDREPLLNANKIEKISKEVDKKIQQEEYKIPSPTLLDFEATNTVSVDSEKLHNNANKLKNILKHYGIDGCVKEIRLGPVITMYEYVPVLGTKIAKITNLTHDIAMSMEALRVRIIAPIPGKGAIGIEIPNETSEMVYIKELITSDIYLNSDSLLPLALGKDIAGKPMITDLTKMPHLLVAGATGTGKSVSINTMLMSLLYRTSPKDLRLILVDPKMLELSIYDEIPHLLLPVVTKPKKAALALDWAVREMEKRYHLLSSLGVRNITSYNKKVRDAKKKGEILQTSLTNKDGDIDRVDCEHMPFIVIVVDELADLMTVASREVETSIMRLAQMARAAGIHLILATQRPSVDVLTGVIKANFPTRMAFQVASKYDSRTILDQIGAENLLGKGDMLFLPPGASGVQRIHGSFVSDDEIQRTVDFIKKQEKPDYNESILIDKKEDDTTNTDEEEKDEFYDKAIFIVSEMQQVSISMIQRRLRIGYNRAARIVEKMESEGIVGPANGSKPREIFISKTLT